jgi:uncharacterized protein
LPYNPEFKKIAEFSAPIRLIVFIGALAFLWLPFALPIYWLLREDSNLVSILTMALLFAELLILWRWWGKLVHSESHVYQRFGLVQSQRNAQEFWQGLAIGLLGLVYY